MTFTGSGITEMVDFVAWLNEKKVMRQQKKSKPVFFMTEFIKRFIRGEHRKLYFLNNIKK